MFKKNQSNKLSKIRIFSIATIITTIFYWLCAFVTRGDTIALYLSSDPNDTFMDYFNMLANIPEETPYLHNANYPALSFVIWKFFYHIIPYSPDGNDGFFLRNSMYGLLGFIFCLMMSIIVLWEIFKYIQKDNKADSYLFSVALLFSGPFFFTYERGNIILLSFIFALLFSLLYKSEKKTYRYIAYTCLAISAAIKIYPAILGIIMLTKKHWKEVGILICLGIVFFILPFFCFDGLDSLKTMINGIMLSSAGGAKLGFGYNFSFQNCLRIGYGFAGILKENISTISLSIPVVISLLIYILNEDEWKKMFALVLLILWIPSFSYTYTLIFFTIPLISFLKQRYKKGDIFYLIGFVLIFSFYALPKIDSLNYLLGVEFKFYMTGGMLLINFTIIIMSITLIFTGIYRVFTKVGIKK